MEEAMVAVGDYHRPRVLVVSLNRPEHHNALNSRLIEELTATFQTIAADRSTRAVILTGKGRSFCAGADLQGVMNTSKAGYDVAVENGKALFDLMTAVNDCPAPVIGRVNGWAIGGGMGLVSCCDLVVASPTARFGFSEVRLGLIPAVITPFVLSRIHATDARELYLTGERFDAQRARQIGLVDRVAEPGALDEQVDLWIDLLLKGAPGAQTAAKELLREIAHLEPAQQRDRTSHMFASRVVSDEGQEGVRAFIEKRHPLWDESE